MIVRTARNTIEDYGPSRARCAGYGGTLASHAITPMLSPWANRTPQNYALRRVNERPRCGKFMKRLREPCYRRAGHSDVCRSMASVQADTARRKVTK